jgi:hypothetical protein
MTVAALTIKRLDCQSFHTAHSQAHNHPSAGVSLGRWTERCKTPELMTEREDLEVERRTAPKGSQKRSPERAMSARTGIE